ncbi:MAG: 50S ribosomal protein L5 [Candidatus Woesearchaeota archaeon]
MTVMRQIRVEKITLNIGSGKDQAKLERGIKLIKHIAGIEPVKTITKKRIPNWGLRPGLPIGCKLTIRNSQKIELLKRLLKSKGNKLKASQFDNTGSVSFGVAEYIDVPGVPYNPEVGIMGFEVCVTLERPGFRIKRRRLRRRPISQRHAITSEEARDYMKREFGVVIDEEA